MVLIAAAVCTKGGKTLVSRQFVEMTKARIEGLLAAFPKLMSSGKQHTFVETDSVRYVYQPLDKLYMLLITTKASNILEDLETLRLFSRVIPEYCRNMDEADISENAFSLIFAFDEIVALGYRESVTLSQIRTYVEMDSHEEKVYQAVRLTQEREAKNKMREKVKEMHRQKMDSLKRSTKAPNGPTTFVSSSNYVIPDYAVEDVPSRPPNSFPQNKPAMAMQIKIKSRDVESFVDQLKSEGEDVISPTMSVKTSAAKIPTAPSIHQEAVHLKQEEKVMAVVGRDGGLQSFELHGLLTLRISDEKFTSCIRVVIDSKDARGIQLLTHPNVDKELFKARSLIGLKNSGKPYPVGSDVGVLKWRLQTTTDESVLPLTINCWPSENGQGGCDVNIEYQLEHSHLELNDVTINIPLPVGSTAVVNECDGEYRQEGRRNVLTWSLPLVDASSASGTLEFSVPRSAVPSDFFPLQVSFHSKNSYADIHASGVVLVDDESPVKFSTETVFFTEKYEIV